MFNNSKCVLLLCLTIVVNDYISTLYLKNNDKIRLTDIIAIILYIKLQNQTS